MSLTLKNTSNLATGCFSTKILLDSSFHCYFGLYCYVFKKIFATSFGLRSTLILYKCLQKL